MAYHVLDHVIPLTAFSHPFRRPGCHSKSPSMTKGTKKQSVGFLACSTPKSGHTPPCMQFSSPLSEAGKTLRQERLRFMLRPGEENESPPLSGGVIPSSESANTEVSYILKPTRPLRAYRTPVNEPSRGQISPTNGPRHQILSIQHPRSLRDAGIEIVRFETPLRLGLGAVSALSLPVSGPVYRDVHSGGEYKSPKENRLRSPFVRVTQKNRTKRKDPVRELSSPLKAAKKRRLEKR